MVQKPTQIRRLTEVVINQINAGEVIERPSNVAKELLENSLDAGATHIEVSLKDGGMTEILVKDNGTGIPASDLALAVERHATSKLSDLNELLAISSFGFRGEALASIASVSNLVLRSSIESEGGGAEIRVEYGIPSDPVPVAGSRGTSVWVSDLFGRVPARKKYLRSVQTELAYISRVVKEAALAHPQVAFYLYHQGELLHAYPVNDLRARFWTCLKPLWEPIEIEEVQEKLGLCAFLSPPEASDQRTELFLFINARPVKNRTLIAAVRNAYADLLGKGHEPTGVVFLKMAFDVVDVNAHPQKAEVRCLNQERLYSWLYQAVRKALSQVSEGKESDLQPEKEKSLGKYVGRLGNKYLVYVDPEGISVLDGRSGKYRLELLEIEKHFNA